MANVIIVYENFADTATLSNGSYEVSLPITNVQDQRLGRVARTSDALNASTIIDIDFGTARNVDAVLLGVPNISPGAQYRVRSYNESGRVTPVYDSGTKLFPGAVLDSLDLEWEDPGFWYGINSEELFDEFGKWLIEVIPEADVATVGKRWWRIEIFDQNNTDGYLDFSRLMAGRAYRPTINYDEDNSFSLSELLDVSESLGGQRTYYERGLRRVLRLSIKNNTWDQAFNDVFRMMVKARTSRQVFVIPDYEDTDYLQQRSFIATFRQVPAIQQLFVDRTTQLIDLEEVI